MNILVLDQFSKIGGGQRSLLDLLPGFQAAGWHTSVAVPGGGSFPDVLRGLGFPTYELPAVDYSSIKKPLNQLARYACRLPGFSRAVGHLADELAADLLYVNGPRLVPPCAWVARQVHTPLLFHCHNRLLQSSAAALTGKSLRFAQAKTIACCQDVLRPLAKHVRQEEMSVVYNGVDEIEVEKERLPRKLWRIGVVGRIESEKGQLEFVRAAALVAKQFPNCRFLVIGTPMFSGADYFQKVTSAAERLPIDFPGWQEDARKAFSLLDLLVVPSTPAEATTRVILEAYGAKIPVVAFPSGGIPEVLKNNETGFLAHGMTYRDLAERIICVLEMDRPTLEAVLERARQQWEQRFTVSAYRRNVCRVIEQLMNRAV